MLGINAELINSLNTSVYSYTETVFPSDSFFFREILKLSILRTEFFIKTFIGKPESAFSFVNDNALARFYIYDIFTTSISLIESLQC